MGIFPKSASKKPSPSIDLSSLRTGIASPPPTANLHPLVSPNVEDVYIWNILPSYQLYTSTFSLALDPSADTHVGEPPLYDVASSPSVTSEPGDYFAPPTQPTAGASSSEFANYENSLLAHSHRLKRLDSFDRRSADKIRIDIVFTRARGGRGIPPDVYDHRVVEFLQGDPIHGYVTICNIGKTPVSFDMFSVVLEGRITISGSEQGLDSRPILFYKFLNMFDFGASWTPASFEDTPLEQEELLDPVDGTNLLFSWRKILEPGVVHKKFFSFTLPERLLECVCDTHDITNHCNALPTLGLDKQAFLHRLRKQREVRQSPTFSPPLTPNKPALNPADKHFPGAAGLVQDFSFPHMSVGYSIDARLVGKLSACNEKPTSITEEYVLLKDATVPFRVIPHEVKLLEREEEETLAEKLYLAFLNTVQKSINLGIALDGGQAPSERRSSTTKQVYTPSGVPLDLGRFNQSFEVLLPYKRKTLTQAPKIVGMLKATFPSEELVVNYVTPHNYTPLTLTRYTGKNSIKVPVQLAFTPRECESDHRPPDIRSVTAKLVIYTLKSEKYPVPFEIPNCLKFKNTLGESDDLETHLVAPFKKYLKELEGHVIKHGVDALQLSQQTVMDVKSLANLCVRKNILKLEHVTVRPNPASNEWRAQDGMKNRFERTLDMEIDFQSLFKKSHKPSAEESAKGALTLVPSFQNCISIRYYYVQVEIKIGSTEVLPLKIPIRIVHEARQPNV